MNLFLYQFSNSFFFFFFQNAFPHPLKINQPVTLWGVKFDFSWLFLVFALEKGFRNEKWNSFREMIIIKMIGDLERAT